MLAIRHASAFANTLVLATNDATLDLSTPLPKVLFDVHEIDLHTDLLATRSAMHVLSHMKDQTKASRE